VYFAAQEGRLNCLQWLIESGDGDPNQTANDGMNPFHAAVQSGQLEAAKWLLESGHCKITSKTLDGGTAVHFAAAKGDLSKFIVRSSTHIASPAFTCMAIGSPQCKLCSP
jgi:ankyrin repeat protein